MQHDSHCHLLLDEDGELNMDALLGSKKGFNCLVEFLEESNAYAKHEFPMPHNILFLT